MKTCSNASSCNLQFESIFAICIDKQYIFSSVAYASMSPEFGCVIFSCALQDHFLLKQ